jgi:hypothetical protein
MTTEELIVVSFIIILILIVMLLLGGKNERRMYSDHETPHNFVGHTNVEGVRIHTRLNDSTPSEFMNARYKVIVDDNIGDNTEPLNDLCIAGFGNPDFMRGKEKELPKTSRTFWNSTKSTPTIAFDDKQLDHVAAELQTPDHRVRMAKKTEHFIPHTGGKSRLVFSSFENSHDEAPFQQ